MHSICTCINVHVHVVIHDIEVPLRGYLLVSVERQWSPRQLQYL